MCSMTNTSALQSPTTLVIGAHGKTGRRVAERLRALGRDVRAVSRSTAPGFDWTDQATWAAALDGVGSAYVTFQPDLAFPGASDTIAAFGAAARRHGLERLVLLSGRGEPQAQACEQLLLTCGVDTTIVRCSFFAQNFSEDFLHDAVLDGVIALPAGDVREPIIDAGDIADVAVKVLTEPGHAFPVYELTGPRLLSFTDVAVMLSTVTGREVTYRPISPGEYAVAAIEAGLPAEEAEMLAALFDHVFDGHNESLTSTVSDLLGRPARDFAGFAVDAAALGAWSLQATSRAR
jgi:uncharacterized protein YbjT (DUF2867 family)